MAVPRPLGRADHPVLNVYHTRVICHARKARRVRPANYGYGRRTGVPGVPRRRSRDSVSDRRLKEEIFPFASVSARKKPSKLV